MGKLEPRKAELPHEIGLLIEVIADSQEMADAVCMYVEERYSTPLFPEFLLPPATWRIRCLFYRSLRSCLLPRRPSVAGGRPLRVLSMRIGAGGASGDVCQFVLSGRRVCLLRPTLC